LQNALVVLDNTMMSPYLMRPLDLGVDIVRLSFTRGRSKRPAADGPLVASQAYDSGTKYLSGHHDLMAGAVTARTEEVGKRLAWFVNAMGTGLPPFDCFMLLRGREFLGSPALLCVGLATALTRNESTPAPVKTLPLRMDRQQASCNLLASYLHTLGFPVHYPGLKTDPGHKLHFSQAKGAGAVMSFETGDVDLSGKIVAGTSIFGISVSFGAVNSLISMPCLMRCVASSLSPCSELR
jgi:cystathionine beta-lyase/cystathionine gamma-synthase